MRAEVVSTGVPWTIGNAFVRKGTAVLKKVPRALRRAASSPAGYERRPPVLANSFPKSGTHLLNQVLAAFPDIVEYGTFLASMPSIRFRQRPSRGMAGRIRKLAPGELASGHLFHSPEAAAALRDLNVVHFFIYRDPRDVAISEAHYLTHMNRWHRLHPYFRDLPDMASRIELSIRGGGSGFPLDYPHIGPRFGRYAGWLDNADTETVRFEDLRGERAGRVVRELARAYLDRAGRGDDAEAVGEAGLRAMDPGRSHTFREGTTGGWAAVFEARHRDAMKEVAGGLLVRLGYERDLDW